MKRFKRIAYLSLLLASNCFLLSTHAEIVQTQTTAEQTLDEEQKLRYPLAPFDTISISIYQQPDLSATQRISDTGTVALPLVGEVAVANLTTSEAQQKIAQAYIDGEFLVKPVVTININSFTPQTITVLGEVSSPGQVTLPIGVRSIAIQRVIALAGDFTGIAKKTSVRIERKTGNGDYADISVVDVQKIIESIKEDATGETVYVYPNDIIFVPRRAF